MGVTLAMQPTQVCYDHAQCFTQRQNCCLSNTSAVMIPSDPYTCMSTAPSTAFQNNLDDCKHMYVIHYKAAIQSVELGMIRS